MGTHEQPSPEASKREDHFAQQQRTIELYEELLGRAREIAHDAEVRLHRVLQDEKSDAQRPTGGS
jgi:hypothetical protein